MEVESLNSIESHGNVFSTLSRIWKCIYKVFNVMSLISLAFVSIYTVTWGVHARKAVDLLKVEFQTAGLEAWLIPVMKIPTIDLVTASGLTMILGAEVISEELVSLTEGTSYISIERYSLLQEVSTELSNVPYVGEAVEYVSHTTRVVHDILSSDMTQDEMCTCIHEKIDVDTTSLQVMVSMLRTLQVVLLLSMYGYCYVIRRITARIFKPSKVRELLSLPVLYFLPIVTYLLVVW